MKKNDWQKLRALSEGELHKAHDEAVKRLIEARLLKRAGKKPAHIAQISDAVARLKTLMAERQATATV